MSESEIPVTPASSGLVERMLGASKLEVRTYEEVEADEGATSQAALVVAIVAIASAIGGSGAGGSGALAGLVGAFVGWLVWTGVTWVIGDKILGGTATFGQLLRTIGFAHSPGVLYVLGVVPVLGALLRLVVWVWLLVAGVIAIRQALDFSTGKAVATAVLGWIAMLLLLIPLLGAVGLGSVPTPP